MITVVNEADRVDIPARVVDLASFRDWADSDEFPQSGRVCYLKGRVWVDMTKEQLFTHIQVKDEYTGVLRALARAGRLGLYFSDGLRLTNVHADISGKPDGTFVSDESLRADRARLVPGAEGGYVELEGTPDMVLEVVSQSSVHKDTVVLHQAYWEAGVREYWLVDARRGPPRFDIFRHTARGYGAARKQAGWVKSAVFGKSFRLTQEAGRLGFPEYRLEAR